jgi:hypothetical protein
MNAASGIISPRTLPGMAELTAVCELSPGHFIQAFTKSFGLRPHQHLMNLSPAQLRKVEMRSLIPGVTCSIFAEYSEKTRSP